MNCEELFVLFEKCGGTLQCNYDNKICYYKEQKNRCILTDKDGPLLDWLLWSYSSDVKDIKKTWEHVVPNIHRYQKHDNIGVVIKK